MFFYVSFRYLFKIFVISMYTYYYFFSHPGAERRQGGLVNFHMLYYTYFAYI